MKRLFRLFLLLAVAGAGVFWWLTQPSRLDALPASMQGYAGDRANGELMFYAGGCSSCHAAPGSDDKTRLAGGVRLDSPFGAFVAPNISPDPKDGIGGWSALDFVNAMTKGVSPGGSHLYPAFPYTSYQRMKLQDLLDLKAYLDTLPAVAGKAPPHEVGFPFNIRRGLGLWKLLYLDGQRFQPDPDATDEVNRGAYLVNGPGHCGECHTPRDLIGGLRTDKWLAGAPNPEGKGIIPNITPHEQGLASWSNKDIAYALESGFTPDFDSLGGSMGKVVGNTSHLGAQDRDAIAAYLKSLPPLPNGYKAKQ
ncbi:MAG: cytochrome c [Rhodobiaceae bacterium]|nr:cytochrome c [Rhodobiaceae bacterium]MCC0042234.1 cytochrome c [Rhodobiaceae bacterium]